MTKRIVASWKYYSANFEYEKGFLDLNKPWSGHKYFVYDLIRNFRPKTIVELGSERGNSFFAMCQAVKDGRLKSKLYAIDTWKGDKHTGFYDRRVYRNFIKDKDLYYPKLDIYVFRMLFDDAVGRFKNNSIDLLHIDGLHTLEAVKHDYDTWKSKVKPGGIILLHDITEKTRGFGVYKLWNILKGNNDTIEFNHSNGLGVLIKDSTLFSRIKSLEKVWQHYYSVLYEYRLLKSLDQSDEIIRLHSKEIKRLKKEIEEYQDILENITSAKVFKIWQFYCKIRDSIIK